MRRQQWWLFVLLIALPALILAILGLRAAKNHSAERYQQQSQTALLADSALSSSLARVGDDLLKRGKTDSSGPPWFSLKADGAIIFWTDRIYFSNAGEPPAEVVHPVSAALEAIASRALTAEAQGAYRDALADYGAITSYPELSVWARLAIARIRMRSNPRAIPEWFENSSPQEMNALTPDGTPVVLLATGYAGQLSEPALSAVEPFLRSVLFRLRSGAWWLSYEQRKLYDAQLTSLLRSGDPDRRLNEVAAIESALRGEAPFRRDSATHLLVADGRPPLLLIAVPEEGTHGDWRAVAFSNGTLSEFLNRALAPLQKSVSYPIGLANASGQLLWGKFPYDSGRRKFQIQVFQGWNLLAGDSPADRRQRWIWYGFVLVLVATLGFGMQMTGRVVRRELDLARLQADFIAGITHDFKNPITGIRLLAERISSGRVAHPSGLREYCEAVRVEADRLDHLISRLLEAHRIQAGEKRYQIAPHCAADIAAAAIAHLGAQAEAKRIRVSLDADDSTSEVGLDRSAIQDALENLLDNAIKYSPPETEVHLIVRHGPGGLSLIVRDSGIGIDSQDLPRIFDRFYRGRRGEAQSVKGTGLGLSLVRATAQGHGGTVEVDSRPGRGSEFQIRIPVRP
jgi:signal transduction histidine kinase